MILGGFFSKEVQEHYEKLISESGLGSGSGSGLKPEPKPKSEQKQVPPSVLPE